MSCPLVVSGVICYFNFFVDLLQSSGTPELVVYMLSFQLFICFHVHLLTSKYLP
jgi:hypothetical protein